MVGLESFAVVAHNLLVAAETGVGETASTHSDKVLGDVARLNLVDIDKAEDELKVGSYLVAGVKLAVLLVDLTLAIEAGMGGHEAKPHQAGTEPFGRIEAHHELKVVGVDIVDIAVGGIDIAGGESIDDGLEAVVGGKEIVGVKKTDDIALSHTDAFVHSIVYSPILFTNPSHPSSEGSLILTDDVKGIVGAGSINHNIVNIFVSLRQHALKRISYCTAAIES